MIAPISAEMRRLLDDPQAIDAVLEDEATGSMIAKPVIDEVKDVMFRHDHILQLPASDSDLRFCFFSLQFTLILSWHVMLALE